MEAEGRDKYGDAAEGNGDGTAGDPIRAVLADLAALGEYSLYFVSARLDEARFRMRRVILRLCVGICVAVFAVTVAVHSGNFLMRGVAEGLSALFGREAWLGEMLAGAAGLGLLVGAGAWFVYWSRSEWQREGVEKYELRKARQRAILGTDVDEADAEAA
jgi:hypothetical protein